MVFTLNETKEAIEKLYNGATGVGKTSIVRTIGNVTFINKPNGFDAYLVNPGGSNQLVAEYRVIHFDIMD